MIYDFQHILFSFDLSNSARRHIYVDDVSALAVTTFNNNNIDYTLADWSFGGLPNGSEFSDFSSYSQFWLRFGTYMDLSVEANRRLFIDPIGRPVWLGDNGEIPTGSAPIVFFRMAPTGSNLTKAPAAGLLIKADHRKIPGSPPDRASVLIRSAPVRTWKTFPRTEQVALIQRECGARICQ